MSLSPNQYTKRRSPPPPPPFISPTQPRSKSTTTTGVGGGFFCKSVLFGLFLLALPLFPSQAPDFVGETVLTKFWELIHLLFVGIAVAYGLFSRRNVESGVGVDLRMSRVDESSLSYVSRVFQVSSVFDDDELDEFESHSINASGQASVVVKERKSDESFVVENEFEESSEVRAWNSQYFQGRSKVVVARPAYGLDGHVVHQPLGLPIRSLRSSLRDSVALEDNNNSFSESFDGNTVNEKTESLVDDAEEVIAAAPSSSPVVPWPEMMGIGDNYPPVDETQFGSLKSSSSRSSSSSSQATLVSQTQNRYSPSRSVSEEESLNSNVEESVKETSLQDSSSRSSSPSLPPSPSLSLSPSQPLPPSPKLVIYDDTNRRVSHSRHYSDGSILKEDVRGRRTEFSSKKEPGSKSLKLTGESSRRRNKSRRSYPPSPPIDDDSTTRRRDDQDNSSTEKGLESEVNNPRARKRWSRDSLEDIAKDGEKFTESIPSMDVLFEPTNAKASRRAMRSSREALPGKEVVTRNSEDEDFDKLRKKEMKSNSLRSEPSQSWRGSSRGKSVRTIRGKEVIANGESSDDRGGEAKVEETRGRTKPRRQWKEELAIVPHVRAKSESEDDEVVMEETELEEQQPQVRLEEEEEEAGWESQSNASHDHNEVDRKAGEFIAKFREQIRLQKLTSGEQPRGGGGSGIMRDRHFR